MATTSRRGLYAAIIGFVFFFSNVAAQSIYPPSGVIRAGSNITLELRQVWTSTIQGKDEDGDWTGNAQKRDGTQGKLFSFDGEENSFIFQVLYGNNTSEYCILEDRSSASGNRMNAVYEGFRAYKANGNSEVADDDADCRVTVSNGSNATTAPQQPIAPGNPPTLPGQASATNPLLAWPVKLEVSQKWEWRFGDRSVVYRSTFSGVDANGVFNGTLITDGASDPVRSRTLQVFYAPTQDTLAAYATDPEGGVTVCSFVGAKSLQNNVLVGETYFRRAGSSTFDVVANTPCRANLQAATNAALPPVPGPPQTNLSFPPQVSVGQTWTISIPPKGTWNLSINARDPKDGSLNGIATSPSGNGSGVYVTEDQNALFLIVYKNAGRDAAVGCFLDSSTVRGSSIEGDSVELDLKSGDPIELGTRCTVILNGPASGSTSSPIQTQAASLPPKVGQTWRIDASGFEPWALTFSTIEDGSPTGTLKQGNASGETFFSATSNGLRIFYMLSNRNANACVFSNSAQARGDSIGGGNLYAIRVENDQLKLDDLSTTCTATLISTNGTLLRKQSNALSSAIRALSSNLEFNFVPSTWGDLARTALN
jgi:hypothetical protein